MALKVYQYPKCSTCRKALKWLDAADLDYSAPDITEHPPSKSELKKMLAHYNGEIKRLFNTSGQLYREFAIKDKLPAMSDAEAIDLLSQHGKLIKRPFLLTTDVGLVGFKEDEWKSALE
jgi:Spx/MgsR family transcriptional regulator